MALLTNVPGRTNRTKQVIGNKVRQKVSTVTVLAAEGRCTLQIPDYFIDSSPSWEAETIIEVDADCFIKLRHVGRNMGPCIGRQDGFTFLTRKGFEFFRTDLEKAFSSAIKNPMTNRGHTWSDFCKMAEEHFKGCEKALNQEIKKHETALKELSKFEGKI